MTFMQWLSSNLGAKIDVDGAYGPQCVDAVNSYLSNVWQLPRVTGNAIDIAAQALRGFAWVNNSVANAPRVGSIVVWKAGEKPVTAIGPNGHTAIVVISDRHAFISADQNWAGIQRLELTLHTYSLVWGWHHPL